jgi:PleD family two-component response regulator
MLARGRLRAWQTAGGHRRLDVEELRRLATELAVPSGKAPIAADPLDSPTPQMQGLVQHSGPLRVILVEDNTASVTALAQVLERYGPRLSFSMCGDSAEALMRIAEDRPDLVITDLAVKPFDGFHLLKTLKGSRHPSRTAVVVVTDMSDSDIRASGGLDPSVPVYHRPLHPERLFGLLDAFMMHRAPA